MTWIRVPLREIGRWYGGGTPSKGKADFWRDGTIPWLSPKDMGSSTIASTQDHITPAAVSESTAKAVPAGSVAVVVRSGILERTLPIGLVPFETTLNQDMKAVVPREDIDVRWVAWGLRAFERDLLRDTRKAGTTVASIEMPRFHAFELPVPSLAEQRRIVEILEDHLSRLDAAERTLKTATLRQERLLLSQLTADVRRMRLSGTSFSPIGTLTDTSLGKMLDAKRSVGEPTPYLANVNVRWGHVEMTTLREVRLTAVERERFALRPGDVLVCEGGEPGRCAVWEETDSNVAYQKAVHRVRVHDKQAVLPQFVGLMLREAIQSKRWDGLFTGTTIKHLPQEKLRRIEIPIPKLDAQLEVVQRAEHLDNASRQFTNSLDVMSRRSSALRRALLTAAFSGKLTGRRTDPEVIEEMADA